MPVAEGGSTEGERWVGTGGGDFAYLAEEGHVAWDAGGLVVSRVAGNKRDDGIWRGSQDSVAVAVGE
jgi:hypothetical protein